MARNALATLAVALGLASPALAQAQFSTFDTAQGNLQTLMQYGKTTTAGVTELQTFADTSATAGADSAAALAQTLQNNLKELTASNNASAGRGQLQDFAKTTQTAAGPSAKALAETLQSNLKELTGNTVASAGGAQLQDFAKTTETTGATSATALAETLQSNLKELMVSSESGIPAGTRAATQELMATVQNIEVDATATAAALQESLKEVSQFGQSFSRANTQDSAFSNTMIK